MGLLIKNGVLELVGSIEDCVQHYSQFNNTEQSLMQKVTINDSFRIYQDMQKRAVDFVSVEFADKRDRNLFASNEPLSFIITLNGIQSVSNFRIALGVESANESPVGLLFSPHSLSVEAGEEIKTILTVNNHFLAKGLYYINLSVGIGNHTDSGIADYDTILKVLFFEIAYNDSKKQDLIPVWPQSWGYVNFQHIELTLLST
jgi:hypothetical protein